MTSEPEKQPPHSPEAEAAVLGAMTLRADLVRTSRLRPDDFYLPAHRMIYRALVDFSQAGKPADLVTLTEHFKSKGELAKLGGAAYLTGLVDGLPVGPAGGYQAHVQIVKTLAIKREISQRAAAISSEALGEADVAKLKEKIRTLGESLDLSVVERPEPININEILRSLKTTPAGISTGYPSLDRFVELNPCELIVLASRPRHGKTTLALNVCAKMLEKYPDRPFIFFSYEMNHEQIMVKLVGAMTGESYKAIRGELRGAKYQTSTMEALGELKQYGEERRLYLVNEPRWPVDRILSYCQSVKAERGTIGAVFVDYLGLVALLEKDETVEQQYARVANGLRIASQELNCPVLAISQISREADKARKGKERYPRLDQMRYSGAIEQEATTVLGLFNQEADKRLEIDEAPKEESYGEVGPEALLYIFNLKSRYGPGSKPLPFKLINGNKIEEL